VSILGIVIIILALLPLVVRIFDTSGKPGKPEKPKHLGEISESKISVRKCDNCGSTLDFQEYHIQSGQYGSSNSQSNIILLCNECHEDEHNYQFEKDQWKDGAGKALAKYQIIRNAIETSGRLSISYRSGGQTPKNTEREIDPLKLFREDFSTERGRGGYHMYLKAFCHLRKEERTFRVGRIKSIKAV